MKKLTVNHVVISGSITAVEESSGWYNWIIQISADGHNFTCGQKAGYDPHYYSGVEGNYGLVVGKLRNHGLVQIRELAVFGATARLPPSVRHVSLAGEIVAVNGVANSIFNIQFQVAVPHEYGGKRAEALLTCGVATKGLVNDEYLEMLQTARPGNWITVQGKVATGGFVQVRSCAIDNAK